MSTPPRRRTSSITRGRKSDRKKKKIEKRNKAQVEGAVGLSAFREKSNQQRKELIRDDSSGADKSILSEPSSLFFEKTGLIRSKKKDSTGNVILLEQLKFQLGIGVSKVKHERMLVIEGSRSSVFQELDCQFQDQKKNLKQEQRESQTEVLEKSRKRQAEQKKIAAAQREEKRLAKEKEEFEATRVRTAEREKLESERQAKLKLERQQERDSLQAFEQQKLESRLTKLELERQKEVSRKLAIKQQKLESGRLAKLQMQQQQDQDRLEAIHKQKLESKRLAELDLERKQEKARVQMIERDHPSTAKNVAAKQKNGLWRRLLAKLRGFFQSKSTSQDLPIRDEIDSQPSQDFDDQDVVEEAASQEEDLVGEVHDNHSAVVEVSTEEIEIEPLQEIVVEGIVGQEPAEDEKEDIAVTEQSIQPVVGHEEDLTEIEVSSDDFEAEPEAPDAGVSTQDSELQLLEEEITVEDAPQEEAPEIDEELEQPQTNEVVLADLRITLRNEPQALEFINRILMDKHNLSKKDVEILINQVASPFSICKTMKHELFQKFIASFDDENISSGGVEPWTQVIQLIGLESLSEGQQIEIYELFMGGMNNLVRKVMTVALLYHFLPKKFDLWWQKEMVPNLVLSKYNSDYPFFRNKNFSNQLIEDARMSLCAFAIEKPNLVANEYTYAKHIAGKIHENRTENWLNKCGNIEYITEKDIPAFGENKYGNKFVNGKITPDILLKDPIQLSAHGQHIHWIDAKKHFIDPALSPEKRIEKFCDQIDKYVRAYGPGLVVWGKDFSEEWNEATEGVVQHIKI